MKSVADEIKTLMPDHFHQRLTQLLAATEQHPAAIELRSQYPDRQIDRNELYHYTRSADVCQACRGLEHCTQQFSGHFLAPYADDLSDRLLFIHKPCDLEIARETQHRIRSLINSHYIPDHILQMTFEGLEKDPDRKDAIAETMRFCLSFEREATKKGLYLHGPMGIGKSAIAGALAHELARRSVDVIMVYVPDFLGEIKSAIKTGEVESKLDALRNVSVLILDDIGAEPLTVWTRDEVIGPIIQRRMDRLPTIYTSNLTVGELKTHLSQAKDEQVPNQVKAARLMERIEPFVKTIRVGGRNRRRN